MGTLRVLLISVFVCFTKVTADAQCPCVSHQECLADQSCIEQICESPCPSFCGDFTICQVDDHIASCYCEPGHSGDPYIGCYDQYDIGNWPPYHSTTKRYTVEPVTVNWHTAFAYCLQLGGRLATIESREENVLVKDVIVKSGLGTQFWISGADYSHQGHWTWMSTGRPFNFTDWSPGQPDNYQGVAGGEHCLELREDYQYLWNDGNCPEPHFPICEYYD